MTTDEKFDLLLSEIGKINTRLDSMEKHFTNEINGLKAEVNGLKTEVNDLKAEIKKVDEKVHETNVLIEAVTNRNIQVIAEGHLDLSRKLDEALQAEQKKEMYYLRVNILENEVNQLKRRLTVANVI